MKQKTLFRLTKNQLLFFLNLGFLFEQEQQTAGLL